MTNFEKLIKSVYTIWGNDFSWYQGSIDATKVLQVQKPRFVIVRLAIGPWVDANALTNIRKFAGKTDLHIYAAPLPGYGWKLQLSVIKRYWEYLQENLPEAVNGRLWLDIEKDGLQEFFGVALSGTTSLGTIDSIVGHKVGIYTNPNYWIKYQMAKDTRFKDRLVWLADYTEEVMQSFPNLPEGCDPIIWQYGQVAGYASGVSSSKLDGNVVLHESRYSETLVKGQTPEPQPAPEFPKDIETVYRYCHLRNSPSLATSDNVVGITNKLGGRMVAEGKEGSWYKVSLYIHESTVREV